MTKEVSSLASCTFAALLTGLVPGGALLAQAQPPAAPTEAPAAIVPAATAVFSSELGRTVVKAGPALTVTYTIAATLPVTSKAVSQKLRFIVEENGARMVADPDGRSTERQGSFTHYLTINTGKYKNLGQLKGIVADLFRRFLATGASAAPNTDLGKIGDVKHGGEMHFVVESTDVLRCEYLPTTPGVTNSRLKRQDVQALLDLLEQHG